MSVLEQEQSVSKVDAKIRASLAPAGDANDKDTTMIDAIDSGIYDRMQYRERYYHPGEGVFL